MKTTVKRILTDPRNTDLLELCLQISGDVFSAKTKAIFTGTTPKLDLDRLNKLNHALKTRMKSNLDNKGVYQTIVRPVSLAFLAQGL